MAPPSIRSRKPAPKLPPVRTGQWVDIIIDEITAKWAARTDAECMAPVAVAERSRRVMAGLKPDQGEALALFRQERSPTEGGRTI